MNSLNRNIKSLERLTTLVSEDSIGNPGFNPNFYQQQDNQYPYQHQKHRNSMYFQNNYYKQPKHNNKKQFQQYLQILQLVQQQLSEQKRQNSRLCRELQKSKQRQRRTLQLYKRQVQKQFQTTLSRVFKQQQQKINEIQSFYQKKIEELQKQNAEYKSDFEIMQGNLQDIELEFKEYSKKDVKMRNK